MWICFPSLSLSVYVCVFCGLIPANTLRPTDWLFQSYHNPTQSSRTMIAMTANRKLQQYHPAWSNCSRTSSCGKILFCMQLLATESIISHHQKAKHHHQQFSCIKFHSSIIIQKEEEQKKRPHGSQRGTRGGRELRATEKTIFVTKYWNSEGKNGRKLKKRYF